MASVVVSGRRVVVGIAASVGFTDSVVLELVPFLSLALSVTFSEETELKVVSPTLEVEVGTVGDNVTLTTNSIGCCVVDDDVGTSAVDVDVTVVDETIGTSVGIVGCVSGTASVVVVVGGACVVVVVVTVVDDNVVVDVGSVFGGTVDISTQPSVGHF